MSGGVPAVHLVAKARRLRRLAAVVEEAALSDVCAQTRAEHACTQAQRHHDGDNDESVAVYRSTPPGENVWPLTRHDLRPAHQLKLFGLACVRVQAEQRRQPFSQSLPMRDQQNRQ